TVKQLYPEEPQGNLARHLETLACLVSGIVLSKSCQLPKVASKAPGDVHPDSRTKQLGRWVQNEHITFGLYFLPFVQPLLSVLAAARPLVFIMDGSAGARGWVTLMVSLIYAKRAIPIAWLVIEGTKGHFPAETQVALLREVKVLVPETATVVFLGDGEFDSPELQAEADGYGWEYVCRTAKNIQIGVDDEWSSLADLNVQRGKREFRQRALFTNAAYGPVMVIAWWDAQYTDPIYLVSNMTSVQVACDWYRKRMHIETFFSDQKSRGFQLAKSHLSDPARVMRLMLAACFAYLWVIYLGTVAHQDGWTPKIHRCHRCDLSLFQLGLRLLDHLLKNDLPVPSSLNLEPESVR
ncbi:MAG: transposase, partial [Pseudomonadota bacterium]